MEQQDNDFSPQDSLQLIHSMISRTKNAVADNSFYFLFWGWLVFICCIVQYILKVVVHFPYHYAVWVLTPLGGIVSSVYSVKQNKKEKVKSFVDEALDILWIALAISFFVLMFVNYFLQTWNNAFTYYILLYAIGTFITGQLLKFKMLWIGGLINFALVIVSATCNYNQQLLITALAIFISYIIPGHLLRKQFKQNKN